MKPPNATAANTISASARDDQVALDHRRAGDADRTNVPIPATSSASGITHASRGLTTPTAMPASDAISTGVLTRFSKNGGTADGSSDSVRWRPSSSAEELV